MDQNESTISVSMSESGPNFPPLVTETAVAAPATVEEGINVAKRKRGRPRMNDGKGKVIKQSGTPKESSFSTPTRRSLRNSRGDMSMSLGGDMSTSLGGGDFTPHIFTIDKGEDIIERIMSFTQNGSRGISVLSANGAVANVKIQPLGFNRNVLTFKDAYEIVSLSSTTVVTEGGVKNKKRGWRITIGGAGGCVFGGSLAGRLIAASPVQVVIGSFWPLITNSPQKKNDESKAVVVPPTIPNALASSSTGQVQQPEALLTL